jgi:hypothetical protein
MAQGETLEQGLVVGLAGIVLLPFAAVADVLELGIAVESSGPALARLLGQAGEDAVGIAGNTQRIESLTGTAAYRTPDILDEANQIIGEVKNVGYLSYTNQLQDFNLFAQQNGYQFQLYVRPSTVLSGPLQSQVGAGNIMLRTIPGQ